MMKELYDLKTEERVIRRGSVWWWNCPEHTRSHIQRGNRPVVVVSNDMCNRASGAITVAPLTTSVKRPFPQQVPVVLSQDVSIVLTDQLTTISVDELGAYITDLKDFQMEQVDKALAIQLGLVSANTHNRSYAPSEEGDIGGTR